jgi:hypothetical protein
MGLIWNSFFILTLASFQFAKFSDKIQTMKNGYVVTNSKWGNKNVKILCQNGHGNGKSSNLR